MNSENKHTFSSIKVFPEINALLKVLAVLSVFLLSSCSILKQDAWPEGAPSQTYYTDYYAESLNVHPYQSEEDYLMWIGRFYEGFNILPGWQDITGKVLEEVSPEETEAMDSRMFELGKKISQEWAKDNRVRLINSKMANIWRDTFLESIELNDLMNFVSMLETDVDALLAGNLDSEEIYFERYYEDSFDF